MAFRCSWSDDELIAMVDCEPTRMSRESMSSSSDESYTEMGLRTFQPAVDVEKGASCEPTLPIPAKTYYEPLMYLSDIRMMASCEPTLMSEEAYYEPTLMTPLPIPVEPEIEMITNITYSKKAELQFDQRKSLSDVESSWFHAKSKSAPAVMAAQIPNSEKSDLASATYPDVDKLKITRTFSAPIPSATKKEQRMSAADHVDNTMKTEGEIRQRIHRIFTGSTSRHPRRTTRNRLWHHTLRGRCRQRYHGCRCLFSRRASNLGITYHNLCRFSCLLLGSSQLDMVVRR